MNRLTTIIKYALFLPFLIPLIYTPFTFLPAHFGKTIIFQIVMEIVLVLVLISRIALPKNSLSIGLKKYLKNPVTLTLLGFLVVLTLSTVFGTHPALSFWGDEARANGLFVWLHLALWYFLMLRYWKAAQWKQTLVTTSVVGVLLALSAFFQNSLPTRWNLGGTDRLQGLLGNPDFLSLYLMPACGLALLGALRLWQGSVKSSWRSLALVASALIMLIALILTQSRGSTAGLIAAGVTFLVVTVIALPSKQAKRAAGLSFVGLVMLGVALFFGARTVWMHQHLPAISRIFDTTNFTAGTGETRLMAWEIALMGFKDHPVLGSGLNSYEATFSQYYNPRFLKHSFSETVWDKPHNWFLEMAVASGLPGVILYVCLFGAVIYVLIRSRKIDSDPSSQTLDQLGRILLGSLIVGYGVQLMFLFETTNSLLLFFFMLAYAGYFYEQHSPETVSEPSGLLRILAVMAVPVVCVFIWVGGILPLQASYHLEKAREATSFAVWSDEAVRALAVRTAFRGEVGVFAAERFIQLEKSGVPVDETAEKGALRVIAVLDSEGQKYPATIAYPVWAGQLYMVLGENRKADYYAAAETELKRASSLSPKKQDVLFLLGRLYLLQKKLPEAIAVQEAAVAADPDVATSHWFLALTYVAAQRNADAPAEIKKAFALGFAPSFDQRLYIADIYISQKDYLGAIDLIQEIRASDAENPEWYVRIATLYALAGDKKQALEYAEKTVAIEPRLRSQADAFIKEYNLQ